MSPTRSWAAAIAALLACQPEPAAGQGLCGGRAGVLGFLARQYREAPVAFGVTNAGGLVEVLTNGEGATWTIIVTSSEGVSCIVAAGEGWRALERKLEKPET